jgi:hypothetical protein
LRYGAAHDSMRGNPIDPAVGGFLRASTCARA